MAVLHRFYCKYNKYHSPWSGTDKVEVFVCLFWWFTPLSTFFQSCWDKFLSSWVEPVFWHRVSISIAVYTYCQMNKNPCSNQEIHMLFEHGSERDILKMNPSLFARHYIPKALQTRLIIWPIFLFAKTLHSFRSLWRHYDFWKYTANDILFRESSVRKWTI